MLKIKIYRTNNVLSAPFGDPTEGFVGDYFVKNFTANFQIKSAPSFSFQIDFSQFNNFPFIPNVLYSFRLYKFDDLLYTGLIGDISVDYVTKVVRFTCEDRTFYLSFYPSVALVRWDTRNVVAVIQYLFEQSQAFPEPVPRLSGTDTVRDFNDPSRTVAVDTTNDETLLAQINTILSSIPNAYLSADNYLLPNDYTPPIPTEPPGWVYHIRSYESTPVFTVNPENITAFTTDWQQQPILYQVECYGAEYIDTGVPAIVNLADKTIADITGFTSDTVNSWVANDAVFADSSQIRQTVKIFDEIKIKSLLATPTAAQRRRASNALYRRAVRFLQEYQENRRYNLSVNQDLTGIEIGNRVRITQQTIIPRINQATSQVTYQEVGNLDITGDYFVESIQANYTEDTTTFNLVVLDNNTFLAQDQEVIAHTSKKDQKLKTYNVEPTVKRHGFFDLTLGTGLAINCGGNGRSFTFTKAAGDFGDIASVPAANAAADYYWYYAENLVNNNVVTVNVTTQPTVVGNTFTFCVSVNGTWTVNDSVRLKVLVAWT